MRINNLLTKLYKEGKVELKVNSIEHRSLGEISKDITTLSHISRLYFFFESSFRNIAKKYRAESLMPSTLIHKDILQKADYFISFPDIALLLDKQWSLNPALCYHVYDLYGEEQIDRCQYVSLMGQCFRQEKTYTFLQRMKNFSMFEIVALGKYEEVETFRRSLLVDVCMFAEKLHLHGQLERAYDPFFVNQENRGKMLLQKLFPLKFELKIKTNNENYLAVASFNHHQDFFGKRFNISLRNETKAHSACVAFGIERWVYAFLSHFGLEEKTWPDFVNLPYESEVPQ